MAFSKHWPVYEGKKFTEKLYKWRTLSTCRQAPRLFAFLPLSSRCEQTLFGDREFTQACSWIVEFTSGLWSVPFSRFVCSLRLGGAQWLDPMKELATKLKNQAPQCGTYRHSPDWLQQWLSIIYFDAFFSVLRISIVTIMPNYNVSIVGPRRKFAKY